MSRFESLLLLTSLSALFTPGLVLPLVAEAVQPGVVTPVASRSVDRPMSTGSTEVASDSIEPIFRSAPSDLPRALEADPWSLVASRDLDPGLTLETWVRVAPRPGRVWVVEWNPASSSLVPRPLLPPRRGSGSRGLATVSRLAREAGARVAINATFFGGKGQSLGLVRVDGDVLSGPLFARTALAFGGTARTPAIGRVAFGGGLQFRDGTSLAVDGFNQPRAGDQVVVFNDRHGFRTGTPPVPGAEEWAIDASGHVVERASGDCAIPEGGMVVSAQGLPVDYLLPRLELGETVRFLPTLDRLLAPFPHALGGGPRLVVQGKVQVGSVEERFRPDVARSLAPRTAVATTRRQTWLLVVAEGREVDAVGLSLEELADFLIGLGAEDALNFDGGGSSTLVVDGQVLNRPTDGQERPVANGIGLVPASRERFNRGMIIP